MEEVLDAADLVWNANAVLLTAGITQRVTTADEVVQACAQTSMLVAAVEALLQKQIAYVRVPRLQAERAANLDDAIAALGQKLNTDLSHISGARITSGHLVADIPNLLSLLATLGAPARLRRQQQQKEAQSIPQQSSQTAAAAAGFRAAPPLSPPVASRSPASGHQQSHSLHDFMLQSQQQQQSSGMPSNRPMPSHARVWDTYLTTLSSQLHAAHQASSAQLHQPDALASQSRVEPMLKQGTQPTSQPQQSQYQWPHRAPQQDQAQQRKRPPQMPYPAPAATPAPAPQMLPSYQAFPAAAAIPVVPAAAAWPVPAVPFAVPASYALPVPTVPLSTAALQGYAHGHTQAPIYMQQPYAAACPPATPYPYLHGSAGARTVPGASLLDATTDIVPTPVRLQRQRDQELRQQQGHHGPDASLAPPQGASKRTSRRASGKDARGSRVTGEPSPTRSSPSRRRTSATHSTIEVAPSHSRLLRESALSSRDNAEQPMLQEQGRGSASMQAASAGGHYSKADLAEGAWESVEAIAADLLDQGWLQARPSKLHPATSQGGAQPVGGGRHLQQQPKATGKAGSKGVEAGAAARAGSGGPFGYLSSLVDKVAGGSADPALQRIVAAARVKQGPPAPAAQGNGSAGPPQQQHGMSRGQGGVTTAGPSVDEEDVDAWDEKEAALLQEIHELQELQQELEQQHHEQQQQHPAEQEHNHDLKQGRSRAGGHDEQEPQAHEDHEAQESEWDHLSRGGDMNAAGMLNRHGGPGTVSAAYAAGLSGVRAAYMAPAALNRGVKARQRARPHAVRAMVSGTLNAQGLHPAAPAHPWRLTPLQEAAAIAGIALPAAARHRRNTAAAPALPATLAAKLAHVFNLAEQEVRLTEAQQKVAAEEQERERGRREKMEEITLKHLAARQRRDAAHSVVHARLQQRAQLFAQRIEAQRLARMEADWKAAERSRRIKAIAQQEQALREAFNEAVEAEKWRLLALRRQGRTVPMARKAQYLKQLRAAEAHYLALLSVLEEVAAQERRGRLHAEQEALRASRELSAEAAAMQRQQVADTLGRIAADEEAAAARLRRKQMAQGKGQVRDLVGQLRRVLHA